MSNRRSSDLFGGSSIEIPCDCGYKASKTVAWLRSHRTFTCPRCQTLVEVDSEGLHRELRKAEKAMDNLTKDFSKTIDINIKF